MADPDPARRADRSLDGVVLLTIAASVAGITLFVYVLARIGAALALLV